MQAELMICNQDFGKHGVMVLSAFFVWCKSCRVARDRHSSRSPSLAPQNSRRFFFSGFLNSSAHEARQGAAPLAT